MPAVTTDWDALLATASMEDKVVVQKRNIVVVPDPVLKLVTQAHENGKYIYLPYNADTFQEVSDIFYSAGDQMTPKMSIGIVRIKDVPGQKPVVLKAKDPSDGVTRIRISVASRRGQKGDKADSKANVSADKADVKADGKADVPADVKADA